MYRLTCSIVIEGVRRWEIDRVAEVEINRSCADITSTCVIKLPAKAKWKDETEMPVKRGDRVLVKLGYDDVNKLAFVGYVSKVGAKYPLILTCEDEMYTLKQQEAVKKAYTSTTIATLLADQNINIPVKVFGEQNIGAYRIECNTVAEILHSLHKEGISVFVKSTEADTCLYAGVLFEQQTKKVVTFDNHLNIIDDSLLETKEADAMRLRVRAISLDSQNKKIKVEVGDKDGELRTIHALNKTEKELTAWAEQELSRLKVDGMSGSFTAFGRPLMALLDNAEIVLDGNNKGTYQVIKNVITFGTGGFRQKIEIGNRMSV